MKPRSMKPRPRVATQAIAAATLASLLASCATAPVPNIRRDGQPGAGGTAGAPADGTTTQPLPQDGASAAGGDARPQIRRGTGQVINRSAAAAAPPGLGTTTGSATFNFEGESLHAVVKAILGDMLGQNYVIAPGVQGTVTLATPKPVSPAEALNLLEMVLGWNNARLVYQRRPLQHRAGRPGGGRQRRRAHRPTRARRAASRYAPCRCSTCRRRRWRRSSSRTRAPTPS